MQGFFGSNEHLLHKSCFKNIPNIERSKSHFYENSLKDLMNHSLVIYKNVKLKHFSVKYGFVLWIDFVINLVRLSNQLSSSRLYLYEIKL